MPEEILMTRDFDLAFRQLLPQKREIVARKIELLIANPYHRSLHPHKMQRVKGQIWEGYIDRGRTGMRFLYELRGNALLLWHLGGHEIVDQAHFHSFNDSSQFFPWVRSQATSPDLDTAETEATVERVKPPTRTQTSEEPEAPSSEMNYFAYFRDAHLRMLGVPEQQVQAVKAAETLNEVFAMPDLPQHTLYRLMDIATSPEMQEVLLNPSQLLYRTNLDRLEGYLEGKIKKLMLHLEAEQQAYVNMDRPLHLLKGTAGCGKTTIGIYRAIRLAEQGQRVLVVTFNRTLRSAMQTLIKELIGPLPRNLEVCTMHSVLGSLLGPALNIPKEKRDYRQNLPRRFIHEALAEVRASDRSQILKRDETFFLEEIQNIIKGLALVSVEAYKAIKRYGRKTALGPAQREIVWKVYLAYQKRMEAAGIHEWADASLLALAQARDGALRKVYDHILVDEAQDLKPVDLRVIQLLVAPRGTLMVLGDAAQTLYSRGFSWVQAGIAARGHTSILRINYRNTSQIAQAASQLIMNNVLLRSSNEYVNPAWTRRAGPLPKLLKAAVWYRQIDCVCSEILQLLGEQTCRPSDIAVLACENEICRSVCDVLRNNGLRAALVDDHDFDILEDQIKVMTIHSAKGLEFPVVFLMGLTAGEFPRPPRESIEDEEEALLEIERARMLCYVGMTRAADLLYLVTVEGQESQFISEVMNKLI